MKQLILLEENNTNLKVMLIDKDNNFIFDIKKEIFNNVFKKHDYKIIDNINYNNNRYEEEKEEEEKEEDLIKQKIRWFNNYLKY